MGYPMYHPETGNLAEAVDEAQFRQVWASRGWEPADPVAVVASETLGEPVPDLAARTKGDLLELAATHGIDGVSMSQSKDEMVAAVAAGLAPLVDEPDVEETE